MFMLKYTCVEEYLRNELEKMENFSFLPLVFLHECFIKLEYMYAIK